MYTLFMNRTKNNWTFYLRNRDCDSFDKLVDLIIAGRLKDSLRGPYLKYCLAIDSNKTLSPTTVFYSHAYLFQQSGNQYVE